MEEQALNKWVRHQANDLNPVIWEYAFDHEKVVTIEPHEIYKLKQVWSLTINGSHITEGSFSEMKRIGNEWVKNNK